jgi:histone H3/H4
MDRYARSLARVAVAQIAEVAGFESVQESAADILADLLCRYQLTLCTDAQHLAELAGRTEMNLVDAFMALEDLQTTPDDLLQYLRLQVQRQTLVSCSKNCTGPVSHLLPALAAPAVAGNS